MRQVKVKNTYGLDQYVFLETSEITEMLETHKSKIFLNSDTLGGKSWSGGGIAKLRACAGPGDESLVAESEKFLADIEGQIPLSRGWRNIDDVVGAVPNIPAFLAGHPQHMRRRERVARDNAPLTIYMDLTSSAAISAETVQKRGIVLLALTRMLVEHRPVALWVGISKGSGYGAAGPVSGTVAWRIDTTPLDLARAAFHISSTVMARGFGYGVDDSLHITGGAWPFGNHTLHCRTAEARLQAVSDIGEVMYIPPIYVADDMVNQPVAWLKRVMLKYVGETKEAA